MIGMEWYFDWWDRQASVSERLNESWQDAPVIWSNDDGFLIGERVPVSPSGDSDMALIPF